MVEKYGPSNNRFEGIINAVPQLSFEYAILLAEFSIRIYTVSFEGEIYCKYFL